MTQVGKRLRELRKARNLTQTGLAAKCGLANTTICDIEAGRIAPSLGSLERLASALGVSVDQFFSAPNYGSSVSRPEIAS